MAVTKTVDRTAELLGRTNALTKTKVYIGIPEGSSRQEDDGDAPPSNAALGYWMETGDPAQNRPARPVLHPGIEAAMPQILPRLKAMGAAALKGDYAAIQTGFEAIGLIGQNAVRAQIIDGAHAPLAARTIKARLHRGRTGTKPLIDTGQLRISVTYLVK